MNPPGLRSRTGILTGGAAALGCALAIGWASLEGMTIAGWGTMALTLGVFAMNVVAYYRLPGGEGAAEVAAGMALFTLIATTGSVISYLAYRGGAPLADARLAAWDVAIGFDWRGWAAFVGARPALGRVLNLAYSSMPLQIFGAIIALPLAGMAARRDEFLAVLTIALVPTLIACALLPAEGAAVYFGSLEPAQYLDAQRALRTGALTVLHLGALQGIVTFPSFHTITAIALINAARRTSIAFSAWLLNGLMILSAPTEGWHYLVDVIGGGVVAVVSIALARRVVARYGETRYGVIGA